MSLGRPSEGDQASSSAQPARSFRLGIDLWAEDLPELAGLAREAESAGFTSLWASELERSAFVPAAVLAASTTRARLGTAIALAFTRSALTLSLEALDLDELSRGRFVLGLGTGVRRLNESWHGQPLDHPVGRLRERVALVRRIIAAAPSGAPVLADGGFERVEIRGWRRVVRRAPAAVPIYLGGVGPQMVSLAGEIGDGWIGHELGSPEYLEQVVRPALRTGLERSGRSFEDFCVVASACCVVDEDATRALRDAAALVAFYATVKTYREFFAFHGFEREAEEIGRRFRAGDEAGMVAACPDEMAAAVTVVGTPEEVRRRLLAYGSVADEVKLRVPAHFLEPSRIRSRQAALLDWARGRAVGIEPTEG
jgi:probable F420-dependent oxidoreductase